jgi:hypothetical protein
MARVLILLAMSGCLESNLLRREYLGGRIFSSRPQRILYQVNRTQLGKLRIPRPIVVKNMSRSRPISSGKNEKLHGYHSDLALWRLLR